MELLKRGSYSSSYEVGLPDAELEDAQPSRKELTEGNEGVDASTYQCFARSEITSHISYFQLRGMSSITSRLADMYPLESDSKVHAQLQHPLHTLYLNDARALQILTCAKLYYDNGEYSRVFDLLQNVNDEEVVETLHSSSLIIFLKYYSLFLSSVLESNFSPMSDDSEAKSQAFKNVRRIQKELSANEENLDGMNLWLLGIAHKSLDEISTSRSYFIKALRKNPFNWCAWDDLLDVVNYKNETKHFYSRQGAVERMLGDNPFDTVKRRLPDAFSFDGSTYRSFIDSLKLPDTWTVQFGYAQYCMKVCRYGDAIKLYKNFLETRWNSYHVYAQLAKCGCETRRYNFSLQMFSILQEMDPHRFDYVEDLANIYVLKKMSEELGDLAAQCSQLKEHLPSSYCVIGNYFSLEGNSEKAIEAFTKGIQLNPKNTRLLILLGQEYLEAMQLDNAMDVYREASRIDSTDPRPFYGMGRIQEIYDNFSGAIESYEIACYLQPDDYRFWEALAHAQKKQGLLESTLQSYQQAWLHGRKTSTLEDLYVCFKEAFLSNFASGDTVALWAEEYIARYLAEKQNYLNLHRVFDSHEDSTFSEYPKNPQQSSFSSPLMSSVEDDKIPRKSSSRRESASSLIKRSSDAFSYLWQVEDDELGSSSSVGRSRRRSSAVCTRQLTEGDDDADAMSTCRIFQKFFNNISREDELDHQSEDWPRKQLLRYLRDSPPKVMDAINFLMKHHHSKRNLRLTRLFAKLIIEVGGDCLEETKVFLLMLNSETSRKA